MTGVPIYTASKQYVILFHMANSELNKDPSGMVGFTRTYGQILPGENITLNAICPHVVRTGISKHTPWFYDDLEKKGLLVDISRVVDGFETFLGSNTESGTCFEVGPRASRRVRFMDYMDDDTKAGCDAATARSGRLWKDVQS